MTDVELTKRHLTYDELACHDKDRTPYPTAWRKTLLPHLADTFASLRQELGNRPLKISSGYRTPEYNAKVGGVGNSWHIQGRALDIERPKDITEEEFHAKVKAWVAKDIAPHLGAVGYYSGFVHIDTRPRRIITWSRPAKHRRQT